MSLNFEHPQRQRYLRRFLAGLIAITFGLLVSVAATHLHIQPDGDAACAVCNAFAGKLEGATPTPSLPPQLFLAIRAPALPPVRQREVPFVLPRPPSCGPPIVA